MWKDLFLGWAEDAGGLTYERWVKYLYGGETRCYFPALVVDPANQPAQPNKSILRSKALSGRDFPEKPLG